MIKTENLDFAIEKTLEVHPDFQPHMNSILLSQITEGVNFRRFTQTDGARANLNGMEPDDVLRYVLHEAIKIYNAASFFYYHDKKISSLPSDAEKINYLREVFPYFGDLQGIMNLLANKDVNVSLHLKGNNNDLLCLTTAVVKTRFNKNAPYKQYIDQFGQTKTITPNGKEIDLFAKVDEDIQVANIAKNVHINHRAVNKCLGDLMSGVQLKNKRNEYVLEGSLYATQDVGNHRRTQEDTTIIMTHPKNKNFKFLAVSDGMGGVEHGDKASAFTLQEISRWFYNLPEEYYNIPDFVQERFNIRLQEISDEVCKKFNADYNRIIAGATFTGAIVTEDKTIIASVGDSRAYITSGPNLELLTRDESKIWPPYAEPSDLTKEQIDDMRFNKDNNIITRCIGQERLGQIQTHMIPNDSYDRLILFSDGVTDLLSTDRIRVIALNTSPENLTNQFVNEALLYDAVRLKGETNTYDERVAAGKDNATATAYIRR